MAGHLPAACTAVAVAALPEARPARPTGPSWGLGRLPAVPHRDVPSLLVPSAGFPWELPCSLCQTRLTHAVDGLLWPLHRARPGRCPLTGTAAGVRLATWPVEGWGVHASYLVHVAQPGLAAGMGGQRAPALLEPGYLPEGQSGRLSPRGHCWQSPASSSNVLC